MAGGWSARARMAGPLTGFADGFEAELEGGGYASGSIAQQLRLMAALDMWLAERQLAVGDLSVVVVERFMAPRRVAGMHLHTARALGPLLEYLRRVGAAPPPAIAAAPRSPVYELLDSYGRYLRVERGLAASTVGGYLVIARQFFDSAQIGARADLTVLRPRDVTAFVVAVCRTRRGRDVVTALRSLLGFLHVEGLVGGELAAAVPSVAGWRLAGLPQALEPGQAQLLLDGCERASAIGRRDVAILVLLIRLGLRRGEVAALELDDVDWRAGELVVRNGKRGRRERLPLPADVGQALVAYLRDGRPPQAATRSVFVRALAPARPLTASGVGDVVRAAGRRAGLGEIGPHRLRHTTATDLLRAQAPLAEIGQLLRHRLGRTTAIYAKVDDNALRELAQPWPEARS
ncbi:MAG: site-specific integrase [Actinobacteria bacterium]|nr:site-specific integrase [Actinomycetota bacterium]